MFGMSKNKALLELRDNMDVAHAVENLLEVISCPAHVEIKVVEACQLHYILKCYVKPMKDPLGVSPSKGNQGTTRGTGKIF